MHSLVPLSERSVRADTTRPPGAAPAPAGSRHRLPAGRALPASRIPARLRAADPFSGAGPTVARDRHEQEADRAADAVVRQDPATGRNSVEDGIATPLAGPGRGTAAGDAAVAIRRATGTGRPLAGPLRRDMEQGFGADFTSVRLHQDGTAHELGERFHAYALTSGRDIFLRPDAPGPATLEGRRLVAHELTHVLQQDAAAEPAGALVQCKTAPTHPAQAKRDHDLAVKSHRAQSTQLQRWVEEGLGSADHRLANSCEWIENGLSKLYAVAAAGDSTERVKHNKYDTGRFIAYFPRVDSFTEGGDVYGPDGTGYAWDDLDENENIKFAEAESAGWTTAASQSAGIAVCNAPGGLTQRFTGLNVKIRTREDFFATLKHEVQHVADRHYWVTDEITAKAQRISRVNENMERLKQNLAEGQELDPAALSMMPAEVADAFSRLRGGASPGEQERTVIEDSRKARNRTGTELYGQGYLGRYKTEFRAYSYEGTYNSHADTIKKELSIDPAFVVPGQYWTPRQYEIFKKIYSQYPMAKEGWDADPPAGGGKSFREAVIAYRDPDEGGANKWNSLRIDSFHALLLSVPPGTSGKEDPSVTRLLKIAARLAPYEAAYLRNKERAAREFTAAIEAKLQGVARDEVYRKLEERARAKT